MLVSAVMPTRGRVEFAAQAVSSFLSQSYPEKELVILDDADDPSFPSGIEHPLIRYHRLEERLNIPKKRNRCAQLAQGEILMNFDSDDWSAPERMAFQVEKLKASGKALTGFHSLLFYETGTGSVYRWRISPGHYGCCTSFCFYKSWSKEVQFPEDKGIASDNVFNRRTAERRQFHSTDDHGLIVARLHGSNTVASHSGKHVEKKEALPAGFPR